MLNNRKVRLMTQLAIYEKRTGKEDFKLAKYYKSDYARLQVLKTAVMVTIAYIAVIAMVVMYKLEFLFENALDLDYKAIGLKILGIYIGIMSFYLICVLLGYSFKYDISRKKLGKYYRMLWKLKDIYREEDAYAAAGGAADNGSVNTDSGSPAEGTDYFEDEDYKL